MSNSITSQPITIALPSDQDSTGRMFDSHEVSLVGECIATGTLTSTKGCYVRRLEEQFAEAIGVKYAYACASGSAAVHIAVAAIDPEPGDEIITTSITDMGALTPILYQGAIPVFADVDPHTLNVTADTIAPRITERTKAIIVTHLFGNPCEMAPIMELASRHGIPVIEDSAQAFLAMDGGKYSGAIGSIGCFSLQQGKHMTTGEGGLVTTNDPALARRMFLFINKAWGYGDAQPDHYFLALNYRMSELQGAFAVAQLQKLQTVVDRRISTAEDLSKLIAGIPGLHLPRVSDAAVHVYWKYCLNVDGDLIPGGAVGLAAELKKRGISSAPRYIQKPAFRCEVFAKQRTFGNSRFPFTLASPEAVDYSADKFPGTFRGLEQVLVLPWNERYTEHHVQFIADAINEAVERLCRG